MAKRDEFIRTSQEAMLQEFAHDPLEQVHFRPFVLRSMLIACGFKKLYKQVTGKDCDLETDLKRLEHMAFKSITRADIQQYCNGTVVHPEIQEVLTACDMFEKGKFKTPEAYEEEIKRLNAAHVKQLDGLKAGFEAAKNPLGQLKNAVVESGRKIDELGLMKADLARNTSYVNQMGLRLYELGTAKADVQKQLQTLMELARDHTHPMDIPTRTLLESIAAAGGGSASPDAGLLTENIALKDERQKLQDINDAWVKFHTEVHTELLQVVKIFLTQAVETDDSKTPPESNLKADLKNKLDTLSALKPHSKFPALPLDDIAFKDVCDGLGSLYESLKYMTITAKTFNRNWTDTAPGLTNLKVSNQLYHFMCSLLTSYLPPKVCQDMIKAQYKHFKAHHSSKTVNWEEYGAKATVTQTVHGVSTSVEVIRYDTFVGLAFHIENKQITPCHPDTAHPLLHLSIRSYLTMLLLEAKSTAARVVANGALGPMKGILKENYDITLARNEIALRSLLSSSSLTLSMVNDASDAEFSAFLLQLLFLVTIDDNLSFTYKSTSGTQKIHPDRMTTIADQLKQMVCNLDVAPKGMRGANSILDTDTVDAGYKQMLQDFGFTTEQSAKACTAPA